MASIYVLKHPLTDEIRYVGQTTQSLAARLRFHRNHSRKGTHVANWIKSLLVQNLTPSIEEIEEVDLKEIDVAETYWIWWYKAQGCRLTNHGIGGQTNRVKFDRCGSDMNLASQW